MKITESKLPYNKDRCHPFCIYAEYEDGSSYYVYDRDEESCMCEVANLVDNHGNCAYYTGVTDYNRIDGIWVDDWRIK